MNILVCPDSFKGSITARDFCDLVKKYLKSKYPFLKIATRPLADGGENTLECIYPYLNEPEIEWVETFDALMRPIKASYIISDKVAYIEMANTVGLTLIDEEDRDVVHSSTFGTGLLIKDAIEKGIKEVILFAGGTATNDGGFGIGMALGVDYFSEDGVITTATPNHLVDIANIEHHNIYSDVKIVLATDVKNVLCGDNGASFVYGPQKGAKPDDAEYLDRALYHYSNEIERCFGKNLREVNGIGAAGGVGLTLCGIFNAELVSGTDIIFKLLNINEKIRQSDLVITGEGKFDFQSNQGKLVSKVIEQCYRFNKTCYVIAGIIEEQNVPLNVHLIQVKPDDVDVKDSMANVRNYILEAINKLPIEEKKEDKIRKKK